MATAPTFQAVGTVLDNTGASAAVSWPAHLAGDIGFLVWEASGNSALVTAPSGWTELCDLRDASSTAGSRFRVYWKRAASASEPNVTIPAATDHSLARIYTFRGAIVSGSPINVSASDTKPPASASTTATMPSVTTTADNCLILFFCSRPNDAATLTSFGVPVNANLTGLAEAAESGTITGNGGGFVVSYGTMPTAGVTGTTTISKTVSTADARLTVALTPAESNIIGMWIST